MHRRNTLALFSLSLCLLFVFSLAGCGQSPAAAGSKPGAQNSLADELTYSLQTANASYTNEEITDDLFPALLAGFTPEEWDFMILEPSAPIQNSMFLQAAAPTQVHPQITVEIRFEYEDSPFRQYRYTPATIDEAVQIFLAYWQTQTLPDLTNWEDMSDELR